MLKEVLMRERKWDRTRGIFWVYILLIVGVGEVWLCLVNDIVSLHVCCHRTVVKKAQQRRARHNAIVNRQDCEGEEGKAYLAFAVRGFVRAFDGQPFMLHCDATAW